MPARSLLQPELDVCRLRDHKPITEEIIMTKNNTRTATSVEQTHTQRRTAAENCCGHSHCRVERVYQEGSCSLDGYIHDAQVAHIDGFAGAPILDALASRLMLALTVRTEKGPKTDPAPMPADEPGFRGTRAFGAWQRNPHREGSCRRHVFRR